MADFLTLDDLDVAGKTVLLRADLNVPVSDGKVTDTTRIDRTLPTIHDLLDKGAKVVLLSHFGRPKGERRPEMSLKVLLPALSSALGGRQIAFAEDCVGPAAEAVVKGLPDGDVALLENLRFHKGEEANDADFAAAMAQLGQVYVNDAFSAAHRAHASVAAIARLLPSAAGRLMQSELEHLAAALERPERPVAALIGGAKVSTKLDLLGNLVEKVDLLVIGGGMANTFLNAMGVGVGRSLCEHDMAETARNILDDAQAADCDVVLPIDGVVAAELAPGVASDTVAIKAVPDERMILDVGPQTAAQIVQRIEGCKTLVWNGPLGCFEVPPFDAATNRVARVAAELTRQDKLLTVAGGGDTVAALSHAGVTADFSYVSTAGGAFLEWLEGKALPGVEALKAAKN